MTPPPFPHINHGVVESVNVGTPRIVEWRGERVLTSIRKAPVSGRIAVRGVNVAGDDQSDRTVHGGPDKAVYSYALEDYDWWSEQLGVELGPATFGENLTVRGVPVTDAVIGERWRVGTVLLEVAQPRFPCYKLGIRMNDPRFLRHFTRAGRPGAYLRIVEEGELAAGDPVQVVYRPDHGLTIGDVVRIVVRDKRQAGRLLEAPELPAHLHQWARDRAVKQA
jgi:MOSC domain-containing protein YiiM